MFGYHPNAAKTYLIVKASNEQKSRQIFSDTAVKITTSGKQHLGAAIGSRSFTGVYVNNKVESWTKEIERLPEIAISQPHAAYATFTHGLSSQWNYLLRTIPDISDLIAPLEKVIHQTFIPALTGRPPPSKHECDLLALPARLGGLGLTNPTTLSSVFFKASTAPLVGLIIAQDHEAHVDPAVMIEIKKDIQKKNHQQIENQANIIYDQLNPQMKRCVDLAKEKGSSSWLSAIPLAEHGFHLHKGEFWDALHLCYGWNLPNIPQSCNCGTNFSVNHAMACHMGGPTIRHNEIRDLTASLLTEVCHNVAVEPQLQPLRGESLNFQSANSKDGARLDIQARGFLEQWPRRIF